MKMMLILPLLAAPAMAEPMLIDDFPTGASERCRYTSDRVTGGASDSGAGLGIEEGVSFAQLRGTVSIANNGGFIQIRLYLATLLPAEASGIKLRVRGNGTTYYIHLRPAASHRPWQYYQAAFESTKNWQEVVLPWASYQPQGGLEASFAPEDIRSIGVVAYGANYEAALGIDWIGTAD
jgi:hypothetical protein